MVVVKKENDMISRAVGNIDDEILTVEYIDEQLIDDINGWNVIDNNGNVINGNENSIHSSAIIGMLVGENEVYDYYGMLTTSNIQIAPIRSLDDNNISGSIENIIEAIEYAEAVNADIVVMNS